MSNFNKFALIQALNNLAVFDNRYQIVGVSNCDPLTGAHQRNAGALSVVFKALDKSTNEHVAIKFFDPDKQMAGIQSQYRQDLFVREVEILKLLKGNPRHLQLIEEIKSFDLSLSNPAGTTLKIVVNYFVVEWVEHDILDYFFNQTNYTTIDKLRLFRRICLSIFNLHDQGICHRDIKPENIRVRDTNSLDVVILDMGTAALIDSPLIGMPADYNHQVGTQMYSPIESWLGLSKIRSLGIPTDTYAIGCMLYELFNIDFFTDKLLKDVGFRKNYGYVP